METCCYSRPLPCSGGCAAGRQACRQGNARLAFAVALAAVGLVAATAWLLFYQPPSPPLGGGEATVTQATYRQAVEAVAASEEGDFRRATQLWTELIATQPDNHTFKLNQAITVLKWIDDANSQISSGQVDTQQLAALEAELDDAYRLVEAVIETLAQSNITDFRATFVEAALLEKKAQADTSNVAFVKQAADLLAAKLKLDRGQLLLAIKFDELAAQLEPDYPELQQDNANFLIDTFERHPRNMFVLKRAAEVLMEAQDPRLKQLLDATLELARPMMEAPGVARNVARVMPEMLIPQVAEAIDANEWSKVRRLQGWLNTFLSMSGFKADGRLAKPDPLALLDASFLTQLAEQVKFQTTTQELPVPAYISASLDAPASATAWYDYDFDLDFDVAVTSGTQLKIFELRDRTLQSVPAVVLELGFQPTGLLPVDLFEVDLPNRPQVPGSVAELMANGINSAELTDEQVAAAKRHNTLQELLLWSAQGLQVVTLGDDNNFRIVDTQTGLETLGNVLDVAAADFESDGDLDLAVATTDGVRMMQNNGNRTFEEITKFSSLPSLVTSLIAVDFDGDTDQDFLLIDPTQSQATMLENILHNQFRTHRFTGEQWSLAPAAADLAVADLDGNRSWDLVSVGDGLSRITYTHTLPNHSVNSRNQVDFAQGGNVLRVGDINNDGALELVVAGPNGVRVLRGYFDSTGERRLADEPADLALAGKAITSLSLLDADGDGMLDLLTTADGMPVVCLAEKPNEGKFVLARVRGINDGNGGGRINHFSIGSILEIWAEGKLFSRIVEQPTTHFGLGSRQPENLRIIFPNGLTQNIEDVPTDVLIEEMQIARGSCPYAYGWNGERFELITDCLWNAPLGLQIRRDQVLPDRRWEHLLLPSRFMQPRNGMIELRITEELWEIAYFDHMQLTAVDHPADIRVFTNEKVGPAQIAEHQIFAAEQRITPESARDSHGRDILARIKEQDGQVVQAFKKQVCQGLTEPHYIELDFGPLPVETHELRLFLTGWMFPTDTSLNIGIDQNPDRPQPEPPSLWVVDEDGQWVCAQPFMGFPGGKTKSIVINLDGVFQSSDHRIRIGSSQQLYWDEAFISWHAGDSFVRQHPLKLSTAELHYRGFSALLPRQPDQPHWFDYQQTRLAPNWPSLEGPFTRFGDVAELLIADDDRMVVMVSGDEINLRFQPPTEALPDGWVRDYVLYSTGWDKDADLNTIEGQGSLPLPFMQHTDYPAPPEQAEEAQQVWQKNASTLTRQRQIVPTTPPSVRQTN